MTDYGLRIKNNNQEIQIDSKYRNLSLDQSENGISVSNDNTATGYYTSITIFSSSLVPLILLRPNTDNFVTVTSYGKSGNDYINFNVVTKYNQSTVIDWKAYRENRTPSDENYGLKVYNSDGDLCFDSGKSYFKIHSVHTINLSTPTPTEAWNDSYDYEDVSHPDISDPFYILAPSSYRDIGVQSGGLYRFLARTGVKKLSSTSVRVGWYTFLTDYLDDPYIDSYSEGNNPALTLIVCKV